MLPRWEQGKISHFGSFSHNPKDRGDLHCLGWRKYVEDTVHPGSDSWRRRIVAKRPAADLILDNEILQIVAS